MKGSGNSGGKAGNSKGSEGKSGSERKSVVAALFAEEQRQLEPKAWYHGLIDRNETAVFLTCVGDFIVRTSQPEADKPDTFKVTLSVRVPKEFITAREPDPIRHFIIVYERNKGFCLSKAGPFKASCVELVEYHLQHRVPINKGSKRSARPDKGEKDAKGGGDIYLQRGVPKAEWEVDHDHLVVGEKLGQGNFGKVFKAQFLTGRTLMDVAVKQCTRSQAKEHREAFLREARIMRAYQHPNIVRLYGVAAKKEPLYIVMELAEGGSLIKYLKRHFPERLPPAEEVRVLLDVAKGMEYLESKGCLHRDLAARNCLLDSAKMVKIADFGLASLKTGLHMEGALAIKWSAPESVHQLQFSSKSDVWSFAVLAVEVYGSGQDPWPGKPVADVKVALGRGGHPDLPAVAPALLQDLLNRCWKREPRTRPSFVDLRHCLTLLHRSIAPAPSTPSSPSAG